MPYEVFWRLSDARRRHAAPPCSVQRIRSPRDRRAAGFGAVHCHGAPPLRVEHLGTQPVRNGQDTAVTAVDCLNNKCITVLAVDAVIEPGCDRCFHSVILELGYRKNGHRPRKPESIGVRNNLYRSSEAWPEVYHGE